MFTPDECEETPDADTADDFDPWDAIIDALLDHAMGPDPELPQSP